jgi:hypothetical protein
MQTAPGPRSRDSQRSETTVETGLEYRSGDPVRVRIVRRGPRRSVSDDGAALARAGRPHKWREVAAKLEQERDVNVSRSGAISLPVVRVGPPEGQVVQRIAQASLALYQDLLDLD